MLSNVNDMYLQGAVQNYVSIADSGNAVVNEALNFATAAVLAQIITEMAFGNNEADLQQTYLLPDITGEAYAKATQIAAGMQMATLLNRMGNRARYYCQPNFRPQIDTRKSVRQFDKADKNNDGVLSPYEFKNMYLKEKRAKLGRELTPAEYYRYENEASNLYEALCDDSGVLTRGRYKHVLATFDAMDGVRDGKIDAISMKRAFNKMKVLGDDAPVYYGNTLRDLIG